MGGGGTERVIGCKDKKITAGRESWISRENQLFLMDRAKPVLVERIISLKGPLKAI